MVEKLACKGDRVLCRYNGGKKAFEGVVRLVNTNGTYAIDYVDGDKDEQAKASWITEILSSGAKKGDRVMARFRGDIRNQEYAGTIQKVNPDGTVDVSYDDGDKDKGIPATMVRKLDNTKAKSPRKTSQAVKIRKGDKVMCRFRGKPNAAEYPGRVVAIDKTNNTIDVDYDDGDKDRNIPLECARPVGQDAAQESDSSEGGEDTRKRSKSREKSKADREVRSDVEEETLGDTFHVKQRVMARFRGKSSSPEYAGVISKVRSGGLYDIAYDDGDKDQNIPGEMIRALNEDTASAKSSRRSSRSRSVEKQGDEQSKGKHDDEEEEEESEEEVDHDTETNDRERATSSGGEESENSENDDRTNEVNLIEQLKAILKAGDTKKILVGTPVKARYKASRDWFKGTVKKVNKKDGSFDVAYVDGDFEKGVKAKNVSLDEERVCSSARFKQGLEELEVEEAPGWLSLSEFRRYLLDEISLQPSKEALGSLQKQFGSKSKKGMLNYTKLLESVSGDVRSSAGKSNGTFASTESINGLDELRDLVENPGSKAARSLVGKVLDKRGLEQLADTSLKKAKLTNSQIESIASSFDIFGDGTFRGSDLCYFLSMSQAVVIDSTALNELRKQIHTASDSDNVENKLKEIRKGFERIDTAKTGTVDAKQARGVLTDAFKGLNKKTLDNLVKIDALLRGEDDGDQSDDGKKKPRRVSLFRMATGGVNLKLNYWVLLNALLVPPVDASTAIAKMQSSLLSHQSLETWTKKLKTKGNAPFDKLLKFVQEKLNLPLTGEELCQVVLAADPKATKDFTNVDFKVFATWLKTKGFPCDPAKKGGVKRALETAKKALGRKALRNSASFSKLFSAKNESRPQQDDDDESKSDDEGSSRGERVTRRDFVLGLTKKGLQDAVTIRSILGALDPNAEDSISLKQAFSLLSDGANVGDGSSDEESSESSDVKDASDESESENESESGKSSDQEGSDSEGQENSNKASCIVKNRKKLLKLCVKAAKTSKKDELAAELRKVIQQSASKGSDSDSSASDSDSEPEVVDSRKSSATVQFKIFLNFASKQLKLPMDQARGIAEWFVADHEQSQVNVAAFAHYLIESEEPQFPMSAETCHAGFWKLRVAGCNLAQEMKRDNFFWGLLDPSKTLKARVKSFLKAKGQGSTKADVEAALKMGDESKVVTELAKKCKIKLPSNPTFECHRLDANRTGELDGKKVFTTVQKCLGVKLDKSDLSSLTAYFAGKQPGNVCYAALLETIIPDERAQIPNSLSTVCKDLNIPFDEESLSKNGTKPKVPFDRVLQTVAKHGIPLSRIQLSRLLNLGDPKTTGKVVVRKLFAGSTRGSDSTAASSSAESDSASDVSNEKRPKAEEKPTGRRWLNKFRSAKQQQGQGQQAEASGSSSSEDSDEKSSSSEEEGGEIPEYAIVQPDLRERLHKVLVEKSKGKEGLCQVVEKAFQALDKTNQGTVSSKAFLRVLSQKLGNKTIKASEGKELCKALQADSKDQDHIDYKSFLVYLKPSGQKATTFTALSAMCKEAVEAREEKEVTLAASVEKSLKKNGPGPVEEKIFLKVLGKALGRQLTSKERRAITSSFSYQAAGSVYVYWKDVLGFVDVAYCTTKEALADLERRTNRMFQYLAEEKKVKLPSALRSFGMSSKRSMSEQAFYEFLNAVGAPLSEPEKRMLLLALGSESDIDCSVLNSFSKGKGKLRLKVSKRDASEDEESDSEKSASGEESEEDHTSESGSEESDSSAEKPASKKTKKSKGKMKTKKTKDTSSIGEFSSSDEEAEEGGEDGDGESDDSSLDASSSSGKSSDDSVSISSFDSKSVSSASASGDDADSWGCSSDSDHDSRERRKQKDRRRNRKRSRNRKDKNAVLLDDDEEYELGMERALKKAFDMIDADRNGVIDQNELGRVMLSLHRECSPEEIKSFLRSGDLDGDGTLSKKEYIRLMKKVIKSQQGRLFPQREAEIRRCFEGMDLNGDGTVSKREFEIALKKLGGKRVKRSHVVSLMKVADSNQDGSLSYEEFLALVHTASKSRRHLIRKGVTNPNAIALLYKIIRGPVPDPTDYLRAFVKMPKHFRPGVLKELERQEDHSLEATLVQPTSHDVLDRKSVPRRSELESQELTFQVQVRNAKGIPVITDEKLAARVLERKARICLFSRSDVEEDWRAKTAQSSDEYDSSSDEGNGQTQRKEQRASGCIGNQYTVDAWWDVSQEDVWSFSTAARDSKSRRLSSFIVRVSETLRQKCASRGEHLCLLIELTLTLEQKSKAKGSSGGVPLEMGCGWCVVELDQLQQASFDGKDIKADVFGGSPDAPSDILQGDIRTRRQGWRALRQSLGVASGSRVKPMMQIRCQGIQKVGRRFRSALGMLPSTIITAHASLPLLVTYHDLQVEQAGKGSRSSTGEFVKCDPVMRVFPKILQDSELLVRLSKEWERIGGDSIRDTERRVKKFSKLVLSFWPYLCTVDRSLERLEGGGMHSPKTKRLCKTVHGSSDLFFFSSPDSPMSKSQALQRRGSKGGLGLRRASFSLTQREKRAEDSADMKKNSKKGAAGDLLFKPFNIQETLI